MADTEKDQEAEGTEEPLEVPKKSKLPLIIGAVAVVAAGLGAYIALKPGAKEPAEKPKKVAKHVDEEGGTIVALQPFIVNLADEEQVSYLKCTIALELTDKELAVTLEKKTPPVRNAVILYLSSLTLADTRGIQNKQKILSELSTRIGDIIGKDGIHRVYLNEFVIQ